jgi:hypothetical protein
MFSSPSRRAASLKNAPNDWAFGVANAECEGAIAPGIDKSKNEVVDAQVFARVFVF